MKWISESAQHRRLEAEWTVLRNRSHRWANRLLAFAHWRRQQQAKPERPQTLASAEEMRRGKWQMNHERDASGRLR
jgi:hypothetical protein